MSAFLTILFIGGVHTICAIMLGSDLSVPFVSFNSLVAMFVLIYGGTSAILGIFLGVILFALRHGGFKKTLPNDVSRP